MKNSEFSLSNLTTVLDKIKTIFVVDPDPAEAKKVIMEQFPHGISITSEQLNAEMLKAIVTSGEKKFRHKFCDTPFLIITLDGDSAAKSALQLELVFILSVRKYKELPTVLLSAENPETYPITNESLISYTRVHTGIRK